MSVYVENNVLHNTSDSAENEIKPVELSVQKVTVWSLWQEMTIIPTKTEVNTTPTAEERCSFTWYACVIASYQVANWTSCNLKSILLLTDIPVSNVSNHMPLTIACLTQSTR